MKEKQFDIKEIKRMPKENCFICKNKINKEDIIYENKNFIAFLDAYPPTKAYTLLATKQHMEDITELSKKEYINLQNILFDISQTIKKTFNPKRICILQSGGLLSHLHFHIIPVYGEVFNNFMDILLKKTILELSKEERKIISLKIKNNLPKSY